jgi:hypothetical protein
LIDAVSNKTTEDFRVNNPTSIAFDPKPFIRSFETLSDGLSKLKRKLIIKIEDIEDQITASESQRDRAYQEFATRFDV